MLSPGERVCRAALRACFKYIAWGEVIQVLMVQREHTPGSVEFSEAGSSRTRALIGVGRLSLLLLLLLM